MKKRIILSFCVALAALASCTSGKEVSMKSQVLVTVNPSTVKSAFHGFSVNNNTYGLDMYDGAELLITSLIYDSNGNLVDKKESYVDNYSTSAKYSVNIPDGEEYTVVAITFSVIRDDDIFSYTIENESELEKLTVCSQFKNGNSFYSNWMMLGIAMETANSEDENVTINVQPASALVEVVFSDIHAFDEAGVDTHYIAYMNNTQASFERGNLAFRKETAVNGGYMFPLDVTENSGTNIFVIINLLPTSNMTVWGGLTIGEMDIEYSTLLSGIGADASMGSTTVSIEAGREYYFKVDCANAMISTLSLTVGSSPSSMEMVQQDIQPLELRPQPGVNVMELVKTINN